MTTENAGGVALDDDDLYAAIVSGQDTPSEPEPASEPVAEAPSEPIAQEAPVAQPAEPAGAPAAHQQDVHRVPLRELLDERDKRQALERQMEDLRRQLPKPEQNPAPELFDDPNGAVTHIARQLVDPVQQQMAVQADRLARMEAVVLHGRESVDAAFEALKGMGGNPAAQHIYRQVMSMENPYIALVEWHKRETVLKEIGTDPVAYRQRLEEQLLADQNFLAKAMKKARVTASGKTPVVDLQSPQRRQTSLPSVNTMGAAAPIGKTGDDDLSDDELYDAIVRKK
jgi:hypothetical protein